MDLFASKLDLPEVVVYASPLDECALVAQYNTVKDTSKPFGEAFGDEFAEAVDEADGAVVADLNRVLFLP
jgi:hypothetical protein